MKYLGPISSPDSTRVFYVDCTNQLNSTELLSSINSITSSDSSVLITNISILQSGITTEDGHLLPSGQTLYFRASTTVEKTNLVCLDIDYNTSLDNRDLTRVQLKVVPIIV